MILGADGGILPRPCNSPQDCCSPAGRKAPGTGCSNPTLQPLHSLLQKQKAAPHKVLPLAQAVGFEPTELFRVQLISSQSRYDRFDTPAYIFWHRPAQRLEKCEISMQDNDEKLGTRHPMKPAVMGFPADKVTCRMQTFESVPL